MTDRVSRTFDAASRGLRALLSRVEGRLLLTLAGIASGVWVFASVAEEVSEGDTAALDRRLLLALRRSADLQDPVGPRWFQESARDVTALGGFTVLTLVTVFAFAILRLKGRRLQAWIFLATVVIAQIAAEGAKFIVGRERPDLVPHLDMTYSSSFPSGHSLMTPVVYLTLAAIVAAGETRRTARLLLIGGAGVLTVGVGMSRVYLGVHWPTDVLGGWALGSVLALAATLLLHQAAPKRRGQTTVAPDAPGAE